MLAGFAAAGLLLAVVGIAGVVAYSVTRRRREVGIRKALGARSQGIRRGLRVRVLTSVGPGVVLGLGAAWLAFGALESLLFGVSPGDPVVYPVVLLIFVLVALLAGDLPARRGARVDPATVLREE